MSECVKFNTGSTMNDEHRERIDLCCEQLITRIDLIKLWPKLLQHGIFNWDDVNIPIWTKSLTNIDTVRDVYLTIKTRGPHAFEKFLISLRQTGHEDLADVLEGREVVRPNVKKINSNEPNRNDIGNEHENSSIESLINDNFFTQIQQSNEPLRIKVRKSTTFLDDPSLIDCVERYPMRSKPRGFVLIIANIKFNNELKNRDGAEHDEANLIQLFEEMGFEVTSHRNLSGTGIREAVRAFSQRDDFHRVDSCFVIITSHGDQISPYDKETVILGVDNGTVACTEIMRNFTSENCHSLKGKPKVFIFQACRGKMVQKAVPRNVTDISPKPETGVQIFNFNIQTTRNYSDMLEAHSTMPGFLANRDRMNGSWFIQILCEVFMNYACKLHLQDLLNMIDSRMQTLRTEDNSCQTLTTTFMGFSKHCFLNPGLFEED